MNESAPTCPRCAALLPSDSPHGLCAACLLSAAASLDADDLPPPPAPAPDLALLRRAFPQLEILAPLGAGGMGRVYRVRQPHLDRVAALKILPQELARDAAWVERFQREARALARLNHPHIVQVFDVGQASTGAEDPPLCWLLMEYVDGVTLRQVQRTGGLSAREALAIVPRLCDAIHYAHEKGVLHRDIKPENILLDSTGCVKVADFGLAKLGGTGTGAAPSLTLTGARLGTAAYMAPEQIETPGDVDHRADIYSLGVVFYELLTGGLPLGRFPAPSEKSGTDPRLDQIVFRTLEKERDRRYQAAGDMKTAIEGVAAATPPPIPQPPPGTPLRPEPRKFGKRKEGDHVSARTHGPVPPGRAYMLAVMSERRGCAWIMMRASSFIAFFALACIPLGAWCWLCEHPDVLLDWPQGWPWLTVLAGLLAACCFRPFWRVHPDAPRRWKLASVLGIAGILMWVYAARSASEAGPRWPSAGHAVRLTMECPEPPLGNTAPSWESLLREELAATSGSAAPLVQLTTLGRASGKLTVTAEVAGHSPEALRALLEDSFLRAYEKAAPAKAPSPPDLKMSIMYLRSNDGTHWEDWYLRMAWMLAWGGLLLSGTAAHLKQSRVPAAAAILVGCLLMFAPADPMLFPRQLLPLLPAKMGGSAREYAAWLGDNPGVARSSDQMQGPESVSRRIAEAQRMQFRLTAAGAPDEAAVYALLEAQIRGDTERLRAMGSSIDYLKLFGRADMRIVSVERRPEPAQGVIGKAEQVERSAVAEPESARFRGPGNQSPISVFRVRLIGKEGGWNGNSGDVRLSLRANDYEMEETAEGWKLKTVIPVKD